jgi:hypothetical protein
MPGYRANPGIGLMLRFWCHVHDGPINPKWPVAKPPILRVYFRFRRHSGHDRTCCRLDPVANDPGTDICNQKAVDCAYPDSLKNAG